MYGFWAYWDLWVVLPPVRSGSSRSKLTVLFVPHPGCLRNPFVRAQRRQNPNNQEHQHQHSVLHLMEGRVFLDCCCVSEDLSWYWNLPVLSTYLARKTTLKDLHADMVLSRKGGPQYEPKNIMILTIMGTPHKVPLIFGNPPYLRKFSNLQHKPLIGQVDQRFHLLS